MTFCTLPIVARIPSIPPNRSIMPPILARENPDAALVAVSAAVAAGSVVNELPAAGENGANAEASAVSGKSVAS
ncbi:hypothetical protein D3C73_1457820 [compost metagenome]